MRSGAEYAGMEGKFFTGRMHEANQLGEIKTNTPEYQEALRNLHPTESGYVNFRNAVDLAKEASREISRINPIDPELTVPRDLRLDVIDSLIDLGILDEDDVDSVKYFTAVHTPLDQFHGVDAFFEITNPKNGKSIIVTMDTTLRQDKISEGHKADVIFGEIPDAVHEEDAYLKTIAKLGASIALKFRDKINQGIDRQLVA